MAPSDSTAQLSDVFQWLVAAHTRFNEESILYSSTSQYSPTLRGTQDQTCPSCPFFCSPDLFQRHLHWQGSRGESRQSGRLHQLHTLSRAEPVKNNITDFTQQVANLYVKKNIAGFGKGQKF